MHEDVLFKVFYSGTNNLNNIMNDRSWTAFEYIPTMIYSLCKRRYINKATCRSDGVLYELYTEKDWTLCQDKMIRVGLAIYATQAVSFG